MTSLLAAQVMSAHNVRFAGPGGRPLRLGHLTTVDMSLELLLGTELAVDVEAGFTTIGLSAPGPYVDRIRARGVEHRPVSGLSRSWGPREDMIAARELFRSLRDLRLDVLHTHNPKTGVLGRFLGRAARVPVVVNTCHGLWLKPGDGLLRTGMVLAAEGLSAQVSHAELYQNSEDARRLSRVVRAGRGRVVGNGVDLDVFRPVPALRESARRQLGVADDELLVGGVGRLVAEKGIEEFVQMSRALEGKARFVWAGPEDRTKPDAVSSGLAGVEWLGEWREMAGFYNALDVFVLPSHREGFSRSAMEAAACGKALVLSDIRGCREIGRPGSEVVFVAPGDVTALTEAVGLLLADGEKRAQLGAASTARAHSEFDQRRVARASLAAYAEVARRRALGWVVTT